MSVILSLNTFAATERISLKNDVLPAIDLVYDGSLIDSEEAFRLSRVEGVDLSKLNPENDLFWKNSLTNQNDDIQIDQTMPVQYQSEIGSVSKMFRINVTQKYNDKVENYILYFDKYLHAAFLRKNLLRKLGYIIPRMKYLKTIQLSFRSLSQKKYFLESQLNTATEGDPTTRWITKSEADDDSLLTITVKDVAVFQKEVKDFKNLILGPTRQSSSRRVIRSLIVPFALLGLRESVNGLSWSMGQIKNETLALNHILEHGQFSASIDDVRWMLKKIAKLTREDFKEVVAKSYFPEGVSQVLLEKILSRRNVILKKMKIKSKKIKVNFKVNFQNIVKDGKIVKLQWDDYASNFAYKKQSTPFDEYEYFVYSKLRSTVMDNLLTKYNSYFKTFNISDKQIEFHQEQFKDGLEHFVSTGELKTFPIKTWNSPFFNTNIIINRDVVVGNYMGSDNMVQLADTTGVSIDLGVHFGVENLGSNLTGFFQLGTNLYRTYTHLKPVVSLKEAYKTPISKLFEPSSKYQNALLELSKGARAKDKKQIKKALVVLKTHLAKGESLIITESLAPRFNIGGSFTLTDLVLNPSLGTNSVIIKRTQLIRKDENTIQVYSDIGNSWDLSFGLKAGLAIGGMIPIINFRAKKSKGKYKVKMFDIDINGDMEENKNLEKNAFAIYALIKNNSSELLEAAQKPIVITNNFLDKSSKFNFLFFSQKGLKTQGEIIVKPREGRTMKFVNLSNYKQYGFNKEVFVRDSVNYYLAKYIKDFPAAVAVSRFQNPGHSIGGKSHTLSAHLQLKVEDDGHENYPVLSLVDKREGWSLKSKKLEKLIKKINKRYGMSLFDAESVKLMKKLRIYDISTHLHLYVDGFDRIKSLSVDKLDSLKKNYMKTNKCHRIKNVRCEKIDTMKRLVKKCTKRSEVIQKNKCWLKLAQNFFEYIYIDDFKSIIGIDNYYQFGSINGFRTDSEVLNDTLYSDSEGRVGDVFFQGPLDALMQILNVSSGESNGWWLREQM